mmetsp:Transcript_21715/g.61585  ORF Transcript_21715/g.61585 Transcript_21715/m.61585 type:complete len:560 (+) Transcript_21715:83-1762(+)
MSSWRLVLRRGAVGTAAVTALPICVGYATSPGFRRSIDFWSMLLPTIVDYQVVKTRARLQGCSAAELDGRIACFHERSAAKAMSTILALGGIYVKLGQMLSTIGTGIVDDAYIEALKPLQDGVPPRPLSAVKEIVEQSVGAPFESLFKEFSPQPVGAASIAQAHRATLADGQQVIVKVQYPEVAMLYEVDFDNLERFTRWFFPENVNMILGLRKRHQAELDFRKEAAHLKECRCNMIDRGFEPSLVRIPEIPDPKLCTQHVLAMEFLDGVSMASAIQGEQEEFAAALGFPSGDAMRNHLMRLVRSHLERGDGGDGGLLFPGLVSAAPTGAALLRFYAASRRRVLNAYARLHNTAAWVLRMTIACMYLQPRKYEPAPTACGSLGSKLELLVRVHGCQLLLDGVYNADPHPGNVLLLPDGRLGLIDYGMVGRLSLQERRLVARVIVALARGDSAEVARFYREGGYQSIWHSGEPQAASIVYRFATWHLDRADLSPVDIGNGQRWSLVRVIHSTLEQSVPDWVEQSRRLGTLLIGVSNQAGRPISLSKAWQPIAEELLSSES